MTTTTTVRPRPAPRVSLTWIVPVLFALAAVLLIVNVAASMPGRETITIVNRTAAPVTVNASGDGGGWLGIGTADPKSRTTVDAVADQGEHWRFRLTVGPDRVGEIRRSTEQLRASGWKITIPADAADQLPEAQRSS